MFEMSQAKLFLEDYILNMKLLPWPHHHARCRGYVLGKKVRVSTLMELWSTIEDTNKTGNFLYKVLTAMVGAPMASCDPPSSDSKATTGTGRSDGASKRQ